MEKAEDFGFSTVLNTSHEDAVSSVTKALKEEGFGVLTEIDVRSTLKKKLDVDFRKYMILGACNPPYAYRTLQADLNVGLLLPCNVIVYETDDKKAHVSIINPMAVLGDNQKRETEGDRRGSFGKAKKGDLQGQQGLGTIFYITLTQAGGRNAVQSRCCHCGRGFGGTPGGP